MPFTFLENSCLAESLPLMAGDMLVAWPAGPNTHFSWRSAQGGLCSQSHPCGEVRAQSIRRCTGVCLSTERRVLGRKVPMQLSVKVLVQGVTTCLYVPVHHCPHAAASLHVQ